jgi:hypothetical protein
MFFSEEKNQKTFASGAHGWIPAMARQVETAEEIRVFWFTQGGLRLSSEKNILVWRS